MLPDSIRTLILDEQARSGGRFVDGVAIETYLEKLDAHAEILSDMEAGRCRGFVAFYCNDEKSRQAYITLVLVSEADRGRGLGRALVAGVLDIARRRGFATCRLEVSNTNEPAAAMYRALGFHAAGGSGSKQLLEISL